MNNNKKYAAWLLETYKDLPVGDNLLPDFSTEETKVEIYLEKNYIRFVLEAKKIRHTYTRISTYYDDDMVKDFGSKVVSNSLTKVLTTQTQADYIDTKYYLENNVQMYIDIVRNWDWNNYLEEKKQAEIEDIEDDIRTLKNDVKYNLDKVEYYKKRAEILNEYINIVTEYKASIKVNK